MCVYTFNIVTVYTVFNARLIGIKRSSVNAWSNRWWVLTQRRIWNKSRWSCLLRELPRSLCCSDVFRQLLVKAVFVSWDPHGFSVNAPIHAQLSDLLKVHSEDDQFSVQYAGRRPCTCCISNDALLWGSASSVQTISHCWRNVGARKQRTCSEVSYKRQSAHQLMIACVQPKWSLWLNWFDR